LFTSIPSFQIDRCKALQAFLVSCCFILLLCFFTPLDIFFSNTKEFDYLFNEIYLYLLLVSVSLIPLLTLILILIPKSVFERVLSLFLVIIILLWAQGTIFYIDYGPLDGGKINWNRWATKGYVEASIWSMLIILTIIFSPYIKKTINKICFVIILTLISAFAIEYVGYSPLDSREVIFDESIKFDFSSDKNVILILVDEVQSDVFDEIISEHPEFKEKFSGFVYYPDTVAGFPYTETSVPNILTGTFYDNSVQFPMYIEKAYLGNSIPRILRERGYEVDLIPTFFDTTISKNPSIASNVIKKGQITNFWQGVSDSLHLIDISIFRSVPHLLRHYVINENKWFLSQLLSTDKSKLSHLSWWSGDENFYGEFAKINDSVGVPVFKFFHLKGCHVPFNRNAMGEHVPDATTRETYKNFLVYNLKRLVSFLDELKSKGIYDRSLIYIFGDHGAGRYEELKINTELVENNGYIKRSTIPIKIKARAIPLFMTKSFSSTGELKISNKPVALSEIAQMVFKDLNIKLEQQPAEFLDNESASQHTRRYLYWNFPNTDPLYEYSIKGDGWLDSSWSGPNRVYTNNGSYEKNFAAIFEQSNSNKYKIESSEPKEDYQFESSGEGNYSITIKKPNGRSAYFLSLVLDDNIDLDDFEINVYVNKRIINKTKVNETTPFLRSPIIGVPIPRIYTMRGDVNIDISYRRKSSSNVENPFEAIYVFKHQNS
jgi:Sulfatase